MKLNAWDLLNSWIAETGGTCSLPLSIATHGTLNGPLSIASVRGRLCTGDIVEPIVPSLYTYMELVSQARTLLKDLNPACFRYSDSSLVATLNRGLHEVNRMRPDAFYSLYGLYSDNVPEIVIGSTLDPEEVDWVDDFQPPLNFYPAVLYYIVAMTSVQDDEYILSGRILRELRLFRSLVLTT